MKLRIKSRVQDIWMHICKIASGDQGSELVEFAFVLPFFLLIIVGLIDFGGAWGMKDKIAGAARDGARVAVASFNDSTNPQCSGTSCAVQASTDAVISALSDANVNTCGMSGTGMAPSGAAFTWTESVPCANGGNFTITVARAVPEVDSSSGTNVKVLTTQVTVKYPYTFHFINLTNGLMRIFAGPSAFANWITISGAATMANLN